MATEPPSGKIDVDAGPSTSPEELAQLVEKADSDKDRNAAFEKLMPIIERIARCIRARYSDFTALDVCEEATGLIWEKLSAGQFHEKKNFGGWCRTVLENELKSQWRKDKRRETREEKVAPMEADRARGGKAHAAFFSIDDLSLLLKWQVQPRVIVLALYGLWNKVPPNDWDTWVDDCGFEQPFPPSEMLDEDKPRNRIQPLARATGISPNGISQINRRNISRLEKLAHIKELKQ